MSEHFWVSEATPEDEERFESARAMVVRELRRLPALLVCLLLLSSTSLQSNLA
jgi:hypothetical protein